MIALVRLRFPSDRLAARLRERARARILERLDALDGGRLDRGSFGSGEAALLPGGSKQVERSGAFAPDRENVNGK